MSRDFVAGQLPGDPVAGPADRWVVWHVDESGTLDRPTGFDGTLAECEETIRVLRGAMVIEMISRDDYDKAMAVLGKMSENDLHTFMGECLLVAGMARQVIVQGSRPGNE